MSNPNPMHARCGLEDCDCEYTIERLAGALERLYDEARPLCSHEDCKRRATAFTDACALIIEIKRAR